MPRTTLDIDASVLQELKALQRERRRSLGQLVSELLAEALAERRKTVRPRKFEWYSQPMHARVDLEDKEALNRILDGR